MTIISNPSDAAISVDGLKGSGMMTVPLTRGKEHVIEVQKDGYVTQRYITGSGTTGWYFGNILIGGIIGEVIDVLTGDAYSVAPDPLTITLDKGSGPAQQTVSSSSGTVGVILGMIASLALTAVLLL